MNAHFDGSLEYTLFAGDENLVDVDIHLRRDDLRDVVKHTHTVDTADADSGIEVEFAVHVPLDVENAVAVAGLELGGYRTGTLVYLNLILIVDVAQGIVARNGVTAAHELILFDVLFRDVNGLFAVELVGHHKQLLLGRLLLFLLVAANKRDVLAPTLVAVVLLVLTVQFVDILLAKQHNLLAQSLEELGASTVFVELGQLVGQCRCGLKAVLLQESVQYLLALALSLAVVATQYGLNLSLGLGGRYKVDPSGIDVLRFRCENLHLVAALQFVAQWHQFVVHLGADTMAA